MNAENPLHDVAVTTLDRGNPQWTEPLRVPASFAASRTNRSASTGLACRTSTAAYENGTSHVFHFCIALEFGRSQNRASID